MKSYLIKNMIIDDDFYGEETVTAGFTHNNQDYSISFNKADMELINIWVFANETSVPAHLSDAMIDSLREDVGKLI
ncbi:hypothetical protein [Sediminibacillus massiliensis]|uniref:hypothetical protein n=1 Tax=Sediminibacillus massiliensis TaxID=1926277 RepID=UPI000BAE64B0|nr:hypothetical protein [Sediminibacillus massiliensis]